MTTHTDLPALFARLAITSHTHAHPPATTPAEWLAALKTAAQPPLTVNGDESWSLVKTMLVKTKGGPKSQPPLLLIIALDSTDAPANALAKALACKEGRMAGDDVLASTLRVASKNEVTPFVLVNVSNKSDLHILIDEALFSSSPSKLLGFRTTAPNDSTHFITADTLKSFLQTQLGDAFTLTNYASLLAAAAAPAAAAASSPAATASTVATKEDEVVMMGITVKKFEDFPSWYTQVLTKTEMMDYYDISGCYIIRPWAYKIWKEIQKFFGGHIEELGVEDCYFPMFVSARALNKEKDHIEGFAPEVAWVTKAGSSDLAEHIAVRPTSETVMYPAYANWVQSHRDLPLRLNQWCNVVRWEFKNPQPFLRTREFLWQEGHTAFATREEAEAEVLEILDLYRRVYEEVLAVPVVPGRKSENEKFAGGLFTTTVEGFIPATGRAIQGATSHCLGQNFAKMFDIMIEGGDNKEQRQYVWQNSWGLTTRTIGVMVMVHGDDKGLVLPPRVASIQAIIVPVGITVKTTAEQKKTLYDKATEMVAMLKAAGVRAKVDDRENYTPGFKFNHWEVKGVPLRLELGPKDMAKNSTLAVRRDTGEKFSVSLDGLGEQIKALLETLQSDLFARAKAERDGKLIRLETWDKFVETLNKKCIILSPWCEAVECEKAVKKRSAAESEEVVDDKAPSMGAKTLCIPFKQPTENPLVPGVTNCFACSAKAKSYTLWGRSY